MEGDEQGPGHAEMGTKTPRFAEFSAGAAEFRAFLGSASRRIGPLAFRTHRADLLWGLCGLRGPFEEVLRLSRRSLESAAPFAAEVEVQRLDLPAREPAAPALPDEPEDRGAQGVVVPRLVEQ